MGLGKNIRQIRKELGMSQEELAARMGFKDKSAVSHYEKGTRSGNIDTVRRFAQALGCSVESLLQEEEEVPDAAGKPDGIREHSSGPAREHFVNAFWRIYPKKSIRRIRVQELCEAAGYHRNTFYRCFSSIYEILDFAEDEIIEEILVHSDESLLSEDNEDAICNYLQVWEKYAPYIRVFAAKEEESHFQKKLTDRMIAYYRNSFRFSRDTEENDYILEYQLTGAIASMLHYFRKTSRKMSLEEVIRLLFAYKDNTPYRIGFR